MGGRLPPAHLPHSVSRMTDMPERYTRLLADVTALGSSYPLVLTRGYAVRAQCLVNRPSQDLDVATGNPAPMAGIAATLRAGLEARGWKVHALETAPTVRPLHRDRPRHRAGMHPQGDLLAAGRPEPVRACPRRGGRNRDQGPRPRHPRSAPRLDQRVRSLEAMDQYLARRGRPPSRAWLLRARRPPGESHGRGVDRRRSFRRVWARRSHHHSLARLGREVGRRPCGPPPRRDSDIG